MIGMLCSPVREIINYRPPAVSPVSNASVPPPAGDYTISTSHAHPYRKVFRDKLNSWSQQGATRHRAATSNTTTTIIRHLRCQSCASHAHVGDLPGDNVARNAMYSSPARPFILLLYQVTQTNVTCQWVTQGGRLPRYWAKRPSVASLALSWKQ